AFGALEVERIPGREGRSGHAEIKVGDSPFMMTEENPEYPAWKSPLSRGGSALHIYLYVEDADHLFNQAIAAGAKELLPLQDQFYGDRIGGLTDPFCPGWDVANPLEKPTVEEKHENHQTQA